jgi:enoyl-CoA hydratase
MKELVGVEYQAADQVGTGSIAVLTLQNPPLNLVTLDLLGALTAAVRSIAESRPRAVIFGQGTARAFCAGSDMREFNHVAEAPAERKILIENHVLTLISRLEAPTIAAIEGAALGGGLELALACDIRVAAQSARLGLPEAAIGGLASNGSQRLTKIVGPARAKHLLLTGEPISAERAEHWGLVTDVVADGRALDRALELARLIATRGPLSVSLSKTLVDKAVDLPLEAGIAHGILAQEQIFASQDLLEGAAAFAERRSPQFYGT